MGKQCALGCRSHKTNAPHHPSLRRHRRRIVRMPSKVPVFPIFCCLLVSTDLRRVIARWSLGTLADRQAQLQRSYQVLVEELNAQKLRTFGQAERGLKMTRRARLSSLLRFRAIQQRRHALGLWLQRWSGADGAMERARPGRHHDVPRLRLLSRVLLRRTATARASCLVAMTRWKRHPVSLRDGLARFSVCSLLWKRRFVRDRLLQGPA